MVTDRDGFLIITIQPIESFMFPGMWFLGCPNSHVTLCDTKASGSPALAFTSREAAEAGLAANEAAMREREARR